MRAISLGFLVLGLTLVGCAASDDASTTSEDLSAHPAPAMFIADVVKQLSDEEGVLPGPSRGDEYEVDEADPLDAVKAYIKAKYAEDKESATNTRTSRTATRRHLRLRWLRAERLRRADAVASRDRQEAQERLWHRSIRAARADRDTSSQ